MRNNTASRQLLWWNTQACNKNTRSSILHGKGAFAYESVTSASL